MKRTPDRPCPVCNEPLNACSTIDGVDETPEKHDLTICTYCTSILKYGDNLSLHELTKKEMDNMHPNNKKTLMQARKLIRENPIR